MKILVSRSYLALCLPEKIWWKPQNCQPTSTTPIFKMMENLHGAHFHMFGTNSNAYNLYTFRKGILPGLILPSELGS